ncbi:MAG: DUF4160 domain-containing protein [Panacagrimonas sp.]
MPELHRHHGWRITMYADDHEPPHFHVQCPDGEAQIALETLRLMAPPAPDVKKALKQAIREASGWARTHPEVLLAEWNRLNRRTDV